MTASINVHRQNSEAVWASTSTSGAYGWLKINIGNTTEVVIFIEPSQSSAKVQKRIRDIAEALSLPFRDILADEMADDLAPAETPALPDPRPAYAWPKNSL